MRKYEDQRTWKHRLARKEENWGAALEEMMECFLEQQYYKRPPRPTPEPPVPPIDPAGPPQGSLLNIDVQVFDLYTLQARAIIPHPEDSTRTVPGELVLAGYIGSAPIKPTLAFDIRTLQLYHQIRLRQPSLSIQAFVRVICDSYQVRALPASTFTYITNYLPSRLHTVVGTTRRFPMPTTFT